MREKNAYLLELYKIAHNIAAKRCNKELIDDAYTHFRKTGNFNMGSDIILKITTNMNTIIANTYNLPFITCERDNNDKIFKNLGEFLNNSDKIKKIEKIIKNTVSRRVYGKPNNGVKYANFCAPLRKADSLWNQRVIINRNNAEITYKMANSIDEHLERMNKKNNRQTYYEKELIKTKKLIDKNRK